MYLFIYLVFECFLHLLSALFFLLLLFFFHFFLQCDSFHLLLCTRFLFSVPFFVHLCCVPSYPKQRPLELCRPQNSGTSLSAIEPCALTYEYGPAVPHPLPAVTLLIVWTVFARPPLSLQALLLKAMTTCTIFTSARPMLLNCGSSLRNAHELLCLQCLSLFLLSLFSSPLNN